MISQPDSGKPPIFVPPSEKTLEINIGTHTVPFNELLDNSVIGISITSLQKLINKIKGRAWNKTALCPISYSSFFCFQHIYILLQSVRSFLEFCHAAGERQSDMAFAEFREGAAGYDSELHGFQQFRTEFE